MYHPSASTTMDNTPLKKFHFVVSTLGAMGILIDGYDLSVVSFSVLLISSEFGFTAKNNPLLYGLVLTSALLGMTIGGVTFGWLADKLGRKTMFVIDLLFFIVFALLSSIAQNVYEIITFRILMGIGIGADYPITSTLISEFAPSKKRGALLMYGIMFYWVGTLLAGVVNYFSLGLGQDLSWRIAFAVGGLIALPVVVSRNLLTESPRWLMQKKRYEEAKRIVESRIGVTLLDEQGRRLQFVHGVKELFTRYFNSTFFVLVAWFAFDVGAYGLGFYTSTLYHQLGVANLTGIALFQVLTAPFPILSYMALIPLIDRYGRKIPTLVGFVAMATVLLILPGVISVNPYFLFPLFVVYASLEQWPGGTLSFAYSVELFPTSLRGLGQGIGTTVSRVGAILGVLLFPIISSTSGLLYGTLFFVFFIILAIVVTVLSAPETKNRTLEEITETAVIEK
jgi:MFS family permease